MIELQVQIATGIYRGNTVRVERFEDQLRERPAGTAERLVDGGGDSALPERKACDEIFPGRLPVLVPGPSEGTDGAQSGGHRKGRHSELRRQCPHLPNIPRVAGDRDTPQLLLKFRVRDDRLAGGFLGEAL